MGKEILTVKQTAQERKMAWMEQAIQEGALSKLPFHTSQKQWERQQDIGITYTFGEGVTLDYLGWMHGYTGKNKRENMRQLNKKFVINLWKNSSPPLQVQYPLGEIPLVKPVELQASRSRGGTSIKVKELAEKGITDPEQIRRTLGISRYSLRETRKVLKGWGIEIPRETTPPQELKQIAVTEHDDKKLQEILNRLLSQGSLRGIMGRDRERKILTTVSVIVRDKGLHPHHKDIRLIAEKVKAAEIPMTIAPNVDRHGKVLGSYYIVYTKHAERVTKVLNSDPDLQRFKKNPVTLAFGESSFLPNTTRLRNKEEYKGGLTKLVSEITGISPNSRNIMMELSGFLTHSPVPIFTISNSKRNSHLAYYFQKDKEQELRDFIEQRWKEMQKKAKQP